MSNKKSIKTSAERKEDKFQLILFIIVVALVIGALVFQADGYQECLKTFDKELCQEAHNIK